MATSKLKLYRGYRRSKGKKYLEELSLLQGTQLLVKITDDSFGKVYVQSSRLIKISSSARIVSIVLLYSYYKRQLNEPVDVVHIMGLP